MTVNEAEPGVPSESITIPSAWLRDFTDQARSHLHRHLQSYVTEVIEKSHDEERATRSPGSRVAEVTRQHVETALEIRPTPRAWIREVGTFAGGLAAGAAAAIKVFHG